MQKLIFCLSLLLILAACEATTDQKDPNKDATIKKRSTEEKNSNAQNINTVTELIVKDGKVDLNTFKKTMNDYPDLEYLMIMDEADQLDAATLNQIANSSFASKLQTFKFETNEASLPSSFSNFTELITMKAVMDNAKTFPVIITKLTNLEELSLYGESIKEFPSNIDNLSMLMILDVINTGIRSFDGLSKTITLEELYYYKNKGNDAAIKKLQGSLTSVQVFGELKNEH